MTTSESIVNLAVALSKAQGEMPKLVADTKNDYYNSYYIQLGDIIKEIRPVLAKYGLAVVQEVASEGNTLVLTTRVLHESGEWIESVFRMPVTIQKSKKKKDEKEPFEPVVERKDPNPQEWGIAITYARRYTLSAILCLSSEMDDDANQISVDENTPKKQVSVAPPVNRSHELKQRLAKVMQSKEITDEERASVRDSLAKKWNTISDEDLEQLVIDWENLLFERRGRAE